MFSLITEPMYFLLNWSFQLTGSLGIAIVFLTIIIRTALIPLTVPGQKKQHETRIKMKEIQPEISKLKKKFKNDKIKLSQAQMDLFKKHNIQLFSFATLLPLVQIVFLIALYHVLLNFLGNDEITGRAFFFGVNLVEKDGTFILPIIAGATQLILSVMLLPGLEKHDVVANKSKSKAQQKLNEKETDQQDMAEALQQQMLYIFPFVTVLFASQFPSGIALYWIVATVFSAVQQYFISGLGGLEVYAQKTQSIWKKFGYINEK